MTSGSHLTPLCLHVPVGQVGTVKEQRVPCRAWELTHGTFPLTLAGHSYFMEKQTSPRGSLKLAGFPFFPFRATMFPRRSEAAEGESAGGASRRPQAPSRLVFQLRIKVSAVGGGGVHLDAETQASPSAAMSSSLGVGTAWTWGQPSAGSLVQGAHLFSSGCACFLGKPDDSSTSLTSQSNRNAWSVGSGGCRLDHSSSRVPGRDVSCLPLLEAPGSLGFSVSRVMTFPVPGQVSLCLP